MFFVLLLTLALHPATFLLLLLQRRGLRKARAILLLWPELHRQPQLGSSNTAQCGFDP
jgi:hypothetical protein